MDKQRGPLTFEQLDVAVDNYVEATNDAPAGKFERWLFAGGLFAAGVGSLLATLIGGRDGLWIIRLALICELVGLLGSSILTVERNWASFRRSRRTYAHELDHDYAEMQRLLKAFAAHPAVELERMLRFVSMRRESLTYRLGLVTGGIERLGFIPVLIALYFQFKDWQFGDWDAFGQVNLVGGLILWGLLLIYLGSWYLIRLGTRLDIYAFLLDEAVQGRTEADGDN